MPGLSLKVTTPEGEDLISGLSFDEMQQEGHRRDASRESKLYPENQFPQERSRGSSNQPDYAKIAKQVLEGSFHSDSLEKPIEFLKQVEWSANTYGLDLDLIPPTMPELLYR